MASLVRQGLDALGHPLTRGLHLDDPRTTALRRQIILSKPFLRKLYEEWYSLLAAELPCQPGPVLELGAGAGFAEKTIPDLITSEIFYEPGTNLQADALCLPFSDGALRGIVMTDVFHHVPDVEKFLAEADRTLRPGGVLTMIEPWLTVSSLPIYRFLHHEPLDPHGDWTFPSTGPLSGANEALPWIVFHRDRHELQQRFPALRLTRLRVFAPFSYLLSGGVSMRSLFPGTAYPWVRLLEDRLLSPFLGWGMFAHITLTRCGAAPEHQRPD
jgi:SAM-dependent methyltransferase